MPEAGSSTAPAGRLDAANLTPATPDVRRNSTGAPKTAFTRVGAFIETAVISRAREACVVSVPVWTVMVAAESVTGAMASMQNFVTDCPRRILIEEGRCTEGLELVT